MNSDIPSSNNWNPAELENVPSCMVCGSASAALLHEGLQDICFQTAPGKWRLMGCTRCGTARLTPRPTRESIGKAYSSYYTHAPREQRPRGRIARIVRATWNAYLAARYQQPHPHSWVGAWACRLAWPMRGYLDGMLRHLPRKAGSMRLLDVGCGDGTFLQYAKTAGWHVQGVDFDPQAVAAAQARGLAVHCGALDTLPAEDTGYDYITASHVIEHVHDPEGLLRDIFARLKPGGTLWIETPNIASTGHRRFGPHWRGLEPPRHLAIFTPAALCQLLTRAGFVDARHLYRGPMPLLTYAESEALADGKTPWTYDLGERGRGIMLWDSLLQEFQIEQREFLTLRARRPLP